MLGVPVSLPSRLASSAVHLGLSGPLNPRLSRSLCKPISGFFPLLPIGVGAGELVDADESEVCDCKTTPSLPTDFLEA